MYNATGALEACKIAFMFEMEYSVRCSGALPGPAALEGSGNPEVESGMPQGGSFSSVFDCELMSIELETASSAQPPCSTACSSSIRSRSFPQHLRKMPIARSAAGRRHSPYSNASPSVLSRLSLAFRAVSSPTMTICPSFAENISIMLHVFPIPVLWQ